MMTNGFNEIDDENHNLDWYKFPLDIQRTLPTIMIVTQQPVVLKVFGDISCTREVFKNVSPADYSKLNFPQHIFTFPGGQWRIFIFYDAS